MVIIVHAAHVCIWAYLNLVIFLYFARPPIHTVQWKIIETEKFGTNRIPPKSIEFHFCVLMLYHFFSFSLSPTFLYCVLYSIPCYSPYIITYDGKLFAFVVLWVNVSVHVMVSSKYSDRMNSCTMKSHIHLFDWTIRLFSLWLGKWWFWNECVYFHNFFGLILFSNAVYLPLAHSFCVFSFCIVNFKHFH